MACQYFSRFTGHFGRAAVLPLLGLALSSPALADRDEWRGMAEYQRRVGERAQFYVEGQGANAMVSQVVMPNGETFTDFYRPVRIHHFLAEKNAGHRIRLVRRNAGGQGVSATELSDFFPDERKPAVTTQDREAFAVALTDALASPYLNDYIDVNADVGFGFIIEFDMVLKDNDPGPDDFPELLWFERGPQGGNSWLTLQAVTRDGEPLGPPLVVGPRETVDMTPPTRAANSDQTFGATGVDLSRLGVSETQYLLVRATTPKERRYEGDLEPDFKFMAVITHPEQLEEIREPENPTQSTLTDIGVAYD